MEDDVVLSTRIDENRTLSISSISRKAFEESSTQVFGTDRGYFVIEHDDTAGGGMEILAKVASLEAAYKMFELLQALKFPKLAQ